MKEQVGGRHRHFPTSRLVAFAKDIALQQRVIVFLPVDAHRAAEKSMLAEAPARIDLG